MGPVVADLSVSLDGFIAGPNDGPGNPLRDGGGRLFDWWTAGTERIGPDDRFKPPARSRAVASEIFGSGAVITGRRTFDIARGWGGRPWSAAPSSCSPTTRPPAGPDRAPAESQEANLKRHLYRQRHGAGRFMLT